MRLSDARHTSLGSLEITRWTVGIRVQSRPILRSAALQARGALISPPPWWDSRRPL